MGDTRASIPRPPPAPGAEIGNYRILELIGAGGMGQVFLAEHRKLGRKVALKMLLPELEDRPEVVARFFHEARAVNQINHEHIVEIVDFVQEPGGYNYFIMELLAGSNLAVASKEKPFTLSRTLHIVGQVCAALGASHAKGIIHRDLKPENIFLITRGEDADFVKLLDFGIAKLAGVQQTLAGVVLGTPEYMSPEQAGGKPVDYRTDLYSLGVVAYWMLSDGLPYRASSWGELMYKQAKTAPLALPAKNSAGEAIPAELNEVIFRCLERDPEQRVQSADEILQVLAAVQNGRGKPERPRAAKAPVAFLPATEGLAIVELVVATPQKQVYRARRGSEPWTLVALPQASASPGGWADRLRALCECASDSDSGLALFSEAGSVAGIAALGRPWIEGTSARALGRGKADGLPPLLALLALVDLAVSLEQLHAAGVFHGDIGPDAGLIDRQGHLLLVDAGIGPALSGRPGSEAADIRALGRLAYLWLTGRETELDPREPVPSDFGFPSRLDRRVPAQVDPLMLRTLQAGGPRGMKQAKELVVGLRQVLRSAGAAISSADVAQWVAKNEQSGRVEPGARPLIGTGPVKWEALVERGGKAAAGGSGAKAAVATLVDMPVFADPPAAPPRAAPRAAPLRPVSYADTSEAEAAEGGESGLSSPSAMSSTSIAAAQPRRIRRLTGILSTGALVVGVVVLGYALKEGGGKGQGVDTGASAPGPALAPGAIGLAKPLPAYQGAALPQYDPNAAARPKPKPPKVERAVPHLGQGGWLTVESNRVARVFVDGQDLQLLTPVRRLPIAPGDHKVRLIAAMGSDSSQVFDTSIKKGKNVVLVGKLDE